MAEVIFIACSLAMQVCHNSVVVVESWSCRLGRHLWPCSKAILCVGTFPRITLLCRIGNDAVFYVMCRYGHARQAS